MMTYNASRSVHELLAKHESNPPSFAVHLYPEHWTLNNGSKFLYNNQIAVCYVDWEACGALTLASRCLTIYALSGYP
jgi:hypothetical protein